MAKHLIQKLAEDADMDVRSYSGRGMFGRECLALEGESTAVLVAGLLEEAALEDDPAEAMYEIAAALRESSQDAMGLEMVLYFPRIPFEDEDSEDEDEDDPGEAEEEEDGEDVAAE